MMDDGGWHVRGHWGCPVQVQCYVLVQSASKWHLIWTMLCLFTSAVERRGIVVRALAFGAGRPRFESRQGTRNFSIFLIKFPKKMTYAVWFIWNRMMPFVESTHLEREWTWEKKRWFEDGKKREKSCIKSIKLSTPSIEQHGEKK